MQIIEGLKLFVITTSLFHINLKDLRKNKHLN